VDEIVQLSKRDLSPGNFYGEFLHRVVAALAAAGGAVWTRSFDGSLALQHQIRIQETNLFESEESQRQHTDLLDKAFAEGTGALVPPRSGFGKHEESANLTEFLLLLSPLRNELRTIGIVEVFHRPDTPSPVQQGYLRFLNQMCEVAGTSAAVRDHS